MSQSSIKYQKKGLIWMSDGYKELEKTKSIKINSYSRKKQYIKK